MLFHRMLTSTPNTLRFLVYASGSRTIAHCLDYDLVTSSDNTEEAVSALRFLVGAHVSTAKEQNNEVPLQHHAPQMYWRRFQALKDAGLEDIEDLMGSDSTSKQAIEIAMLYKEDGQTLDAIQ